MLQFDNEVYIAVTWRCQGDGGLVLWLHRDLLITYPACTSTLMKREHNRKISVSVKRIMCDESDKNEWIKSLVMTLLSYAKWFKMMKGSCCRHPVKLVRLYRFPRFCEVAILVLQTCKAIALPLACRLIRWQKRLLFPLFVNWHVVNPIFNKNIMCW